MSASEELRYQFERVARRVDRIGDEIADIEKRLDTLERQQYSTLTRLLKVESDTESR